MPIQFFCPRWGSEDISWERFLPKIKDAGYDGLEWAIANSTEEKEIEKVFALAQKHDIPVIAQHYETNASDFSKHAEEYKNWWEKIKSFPALKVNSQTGKDYFSFEQNKELIETAAAYAKEMGKRIVHETHRGKFSFAAHITRTYLERIPDLKLTFDISHWMNVAESYLEDQEDTLIMASERAEHIHARVGFPEGPQVSDPRAPEWSAAVERHLRWWTRIAKNTQDLTITPEFGPFPYMVHDPSTGQPLVSQWDTNIYMMNLLRSTL